MQARMTKLNNVVIEKTAKKDPVEANDQVRYSL